MYEASFTCYIGTRVRMLVTRTLTQTGISSVFCQRLCRSEKLWACLAEPSGCLFDIVRCLGWFELGFENANLPSAHYIC